MDDKEKRYSKELLGKTIVSKSGKKFGEIDIILNQTEKEIENQLGKV